MSTNQFFSDDSYVCLGVHPQASDRDIRLACREVIGSGTPTSTMIRPRMASGLQITFFGGFKQHTKRHKTPVI